MANLMKMLFILTVLGVSFIAYPALQPLSARSQQPSSFLIHYHESIDAVLGDSPFQLFSFTGLAEEKVTLAVYGLDTGIVPALVLLDPSGRTLAEDINPDQNAVAFLQVTIPRNGLYVFLVTQRNEEVSGMMRVMLIQGDPLDQDITLQDSVDPLLPGRAFLLSGSNPTADLPLTVALQSLPFESNPNLSLPQFFASRADQFDPPSAAERTTPVEFVSWINNDAERLYVVTIQAVPSVTQQNLPTMQDSSNLLLMPFNYLLTLNEGAEVQQFHNPICRVIVPQLSTSPWPVYLEPDQAAPVIGHVSQGSPLEIVSIDDSSEWLQIAWTGTLFGTAWISNTRAFDLTSAGCIRVEPLIQPDWSLLDNVIQETVNRIEHAEPTPEVPPAQPSNPVPTAQPQPTSNPEPQPTQEPILDVPPIDVPPIDLDPGDTLPIEVPTIDLPPIDLPPVNVPPLLPGG